jgi:protein disulfide-isomerase A1
LIANAEVVPFDNSAIEKIFQNKKSALFLFASDNDASTAAKEAFKQYDEAGADVILTVSEANDGHGLFDRLAEYLGVDAKSTPRVLYLGEKQDKYSFEGEVTKDALASFISKVQAGEVEQFLKSAPIPESNDEPVKIGVGKNFKEMVLDSDKEFLV